MTSRTTEHATPQQTRSRVIFWLAIILALLMFPHRLPMVAQLHPNIHPLAMHFGELLNPQITFGDMLGTASLIRQLLRIVVGAAFAYPVAWLVYRRRATLSLGARWATLLGLPLGLTALWGALAAIVPLASGDEVVGETLLTLPAAHAIEQLCVIAVLLPALAAVAEGRGFFMLAGEDDVQEGGDQRRLLIPGALVCLSAVMVQTGLYGLIMPAVVMHGLLQALPWAIALGFHYTIAWARPEEA